MTPQALTELKARCLTARQYRRAIANAAAHVAALEKIAGPVKLGPGVAKHSAAHLLALIERVEQVQSGQEVKAEPAAPEPAPAAPPPPIVVAPEPDPEPEPPPAPEPVPAEADQAAAEPEESEPKAEKKAKRKSKSKKAKDEESDA